MAIDITVLSVWHNRAAKVDASIASLADQDYDGFRAIVVDDASRDDTYARLERHRSDRIVVRQQANAGFTRTMMALCAEAETDFIAVHGAGDESLRHRLAAQRAFLLDHPHVVAVGCGIENVDELSGRRWQVMPDATIRPGPISGAFGISHGEVMFRRDAYLRSGGYRDAFTIGQASDLFRRMSRLGDFGYVPEVLYRRYLMADGVSAKADKVAQRTILAAISTAVHRREVSRAGTAGVEACAVLRDDLDRFGLLLPYLAEPDARIARAIASAAIVYWSAGDRRTGLRLARRSLGEKWSTFAWVVLALVGLGTGPLRAPMLKVARRVSRGEGEFALRRLSGPG
ncbi:Glycosyl transferase family 2 [Sphingomonas gellani]|uniref:Glycosyl transferase family 2 n=1 Tax=Sphingomonas gellani TaxID=1166340 RepID=A0A1H8HXG3_9SPHN|nr:glycosyltransferase family A protein [Sphingomonas gellani]SEN60378.1 Glycosyl transferase family 2 [Sphingomonas gellani]